MNSFGVHPWTCNMSLHAWINPYDPAACDVDQPPVLWINPFMVRELSSKTFSSETLLAGVGLVKQEAGMDDLAGMATEDMETELKALEACIFVMFGFSIWCCFISP